MGSRRASERTPQYYTTGYLEAVDDPPHVNHTTFSQSERTPQYHTIGYVQSELRQAPSTNVQQNAPKRSSSSSSSARSGTSAAGGAAGYKEPSNNSIYKDYGGYQNFLLCHGLKLWNSEDVAEGHQILNEIKQNMRDEYEASQAPPARTSAQSNPKSKRPTESSRTKR